MTRQLPRPSVGQIALSGVVLWVVVWLFASNSWNTPTLGLSYESWNQLMAAPIAVLLAASLLGALRSRRFVRLALLVVSLGLAAGLAGSVLEFWVAGGIRTGSGNRELSIAGWTMFLLGHAVAVLGMVCAGAAGAGRRDES